ncbi:DUF4349 domain-containing protein [Streptomyces sp. TR02-1]|uniref:DUF4349 domain-containing protein n=1 Tax=Streptomyces sp. TR02-1 TaxID=3385977 RepID=UPI0039A3B396
MVRNSRRRPTVRRPRMRGTRVLGAALLVCTIAVSGCGAAGDSGADSSAGAVADEAAAGAGDARTGPEAPGTDGSAEDSASDGSGTSGTARAAEAAERQVVRKAWLTVETKDVRGGLEEARDVVETADGYVAQESTRRDGDGTEYSRVTFRVPQDEYRPVLESLADTGELVERGATANDVTGDVVDVESRISTQRASVTRVRKLMDDATTLTDVVTLESELRSRQADLEALEARLESLESRTAMATVKLELRSPDAAPVGEEEDTTVGDAVSGGWHAFLTVLRWIAIGLGASLPFLAALALLYAAVRRVLPARWERSAAAPEPVTVPSPVSSSHDDD